MVEFALFAGVWLLLTLLFKNRLGLPLALVVATLKTAAFAILWISSAHQPFFLNDGEQYYGGAFRILREYNPFNVWITSHGRDKMEEMAGYGPHWFYTWWNALVVWIFGDMKLALPAVNVVLSGLLALFAGSLAVACGAPRVYATGLIVLVGLHPDIVAWSSLTNTKDTIVALLITVSLLSLARLRRHLGLPWILALVSSLFLLIGLRYYMIVLILGSAILAVAIDLHARHRRAIWFAVVVVAVGGAFVLFMTPHFLIKHADRLDVTIIPMGAVKYILSPRPWSIVEPYEFLFIPSIWNWATIAIVAPGFWLLWRDHPLARPALVLIVMAVLFYAAEESLRGPRQRLQIDALLAWTQFHFFYYVTRMSLARDANRDNAEEPARA